MNTTTRNHVLGFFLSLTAAAMWGMLPVALKELLAGMDASTIVWYRFLVAAVVLLAWLALRNELPGIMQMDNRMRWFFFIAAIGLCINYYLFSASLNYVNAETSEVVIQLTTLFLILGGVVFYREPFIGMQKFGTLLIVAGMLLFFHDRQAEFTSLESEELTGVLMVVLAAVTWTVFALLQKRLLRAFTAPQILLLIYLFSILVLLPFIAPAGLFSLSPFHLGLLAFCCINTLIAYGCFTEALNLWHASKVSAVLALAPLFTIATLEILVYFNPDYPFSDRLSWLSIIGALVLVAGSVLTALIPILSRKHRAAASGAE